MTIDNGSQKRVAAAVYLAAMFMSVLDTTIVAVALPAVAREFGVSAVAAGSVQIAYLVALTVFIPVSGWLGDLIGGKRALLAAIGVFTVGSALCGLAPSMVWLIVFSVVQGIGGAVMLPVGLAMVFRVYPPGERVHLSSTLALVTAIGPALGPILGGVLSSYASWRWVFLVNLPIGVAALIVGAFRLAPHQQPHPGRLEVPGLLLSALGLGALMGGVSLAPTLGWGNPVVLALTLGGVVLLAVLVAVERRSDHPLIHVRLFADRLFTAASSLYGLGSIAYIGTLYAVSLFLQEGLGYSPLISGLTSVGSALGVIAGSQLVTRLIYPRLGPRRLLAAGLIVIAISLALLALVHSGTSLWLVRLDLFALGLGVSAVFIPSQAVSMATISNADVGKASPVFNAAKQLGSAVGVALLGTAIAIGSAPATAQGQPTAASSLIGYQIAFLVAALVALLSLPVAFGVSDSQAEATIRRRA